MDQLLNEFVQTHSSSTLSHIISNLDANPNNDLMEKILQIIESKESEDLFCQFLGSLTELSSKHSWIFLFVFGMQKKLWSKIDEIKSSNLLKALIISSINLCQCAQEFSQDVDSFFVSLLLRKDLFEQCSLKGNDGIQILLLKLYFEVIMQWEGQNGNLVEQWFSLINCPKISPSALMILLSLSVTSVKAKPKLAQYVLPVLLDLHENPRKYFSPTQTKSIQHTLKLQLVEITKASILPAEVIPFIDEALIELGVGKCAVISKSLSRRKQAAIAQSLREKQRKARAEDEEAMAKNEEYEEDDVSFIDSTCIPLPWIVEILLSTLSESSNAALQAATANWKPPSSISCQGNGNSQRKAKSRDPRLAEMQSLEDSEQNHSRNTNSPSLESTNESAMDLDDEQESTKECEFLRFIFARFLSQEQIAVKFGLKSHWTNILTRLVNLLASSTSKTTARSFAGIKEAFLKFVFENFRERSDLALFCLNYEWMMDLQAKSGENAAEDQSSLKYPVLFAQFLTKLASEQSSIDPRDKTFTKFLCEAPYIPDYESVLDLLRIYCSDSQRIALGLYTLRQLNIERPNAKEIFLPLLIEYCFSPEDELRSGAIKMVSSSVILCKESSLLQAAIHKMAVYLNATGEILNEQIRLESEAEILGTFPTVISDIEVTLFNQNCDLYFELCSQNPFLLQELISFYPKAGDNCKLLIRNQISSLAELEICQEELLKILRVFPSGCETLCTRIVIALRESSCILSIVDELIASKKADGSLYVPLIECGALKGNRLLFDFLPAICALIDTQTRGKLSQEIITRLIDAKNELLTPLDLLMYFHRTEESKIGLKKCMEGIQVCFTLLQTFTQAVFGQLLQRLMEESAKGQPLPILFMRTVIQSVSVYKSLQTMVIQILTKLSARRIWEQPKLWEGWIRCCKILLPHSLPIILQLPLSSFKDLIARAPDMSPFVGDYIRQQPTSLRNRLTAYAKLLK